MNNIYENCFYAIYVHKNRKYELSYISYDLDEAKSQVYNAMKYKYIYKSPLIDRIVRIPLFDGTEKYTIYESNSLYDGNELKIKIEAVVPE